MTASAVPIRIGAETDPAQVMVEVGLRIARDQSLG